MTILLPRRVLATIKHLADHSFVGYPPSKFNNNLYLSVFNVLCECFAYIYMYMYIFLFCPDKGLRGRNINELLHPNT